MNNANFHLKSEKKSHFLQDPLVIGKRVFHSRLFLGSGKFSSHQQMIDAIKISSCEVVTMALRRIDLRKDHDGFFEALKQTKAQFLPNTSGARTAQEAVRIAKLCAHSTNEKWVKLEVIPDAQHLLPDPVETLKAAEELTKEGFEVYPYVNADPVLCKKLEEIGCPCVMPLGAPIGSNRGLETLEQLKIIIDNAQIPVIIDAGIGRPSQACQALEIGAHAVMLNTAVAMAQNPVMMSHSFSQAIIAGRQAFLAKLPEIKNKACASSPLTHFLYEKKENEDGLK